MARLEVTQTDGCTHVTLHDGDVGEGFSYEGVEADPLMLVRFLQNLIDRTEERITGTSTNKMAMDAVRAINAGMLPSKYVEADTSS